jgi:hypothetical protein
MFIPSFQARPRRGPSSPGFLAKLIAPFKNEKKAKGPKSPKKAEKTKEAEVSFSFRTHIRN